MIRSTRTACTLLLFALLLAPVCVMAQTTESVVDLEPVESESPEPEEELEKRQAIALFVGNTHSDGENGFTLGLDYSYRFNRWISLGAMVDYAGKDFRSFIAGIPIFLHATERLMFELAPGVEHSDGENNALVRLGVLYKFPVGPVALTPLLAADFVDSETVYVMGLNIEWEF